VTAGGLGDMGPAHRLFCVLAGMGGSPPSAPVQGQRNWPQAGL